MDGERERERKGERGYLLGEASRKDGIILSNKGDSVCRLEFSDECNNVEILQYKLFYIAVGRDSVTLYFHLLKWHPDIPPN